MKTFKSFNIGIGLIALLLTAMLLVACGDSPTATQAPTTAAATTAAATTTAAPTTAAATTAAPTTAIATTAAPTTAVPTAAATTAAPTTAAATGVLPVPAGTRPLKFSPGVTKTLIGQFGTGAGTTNVTFESYVSNQTPVDLSKFYDQKLVELGYTSHPDTQKGQQQGNVSLLSASFTRVNKAGVTEVTSIALIGPLDAAVINEIAGFETASTVDPASDVTKQLKAGDTLIMSFVFAAPGGVTAPATTAAATVAAGGFPVPAGAKPWNLSLAANKAVFGDFTTKFGSAQVQVNTFITSATPDKLSSYYDQAMVTQGYAAHPDTNTADSRNGVNLLTAQFTKADQIAIVVLVGPLDAGTLGDIVTKINTTNPTGDVTNQLKVGDTIILSYIGTKPATAATTAAATKPATTTAAATVAPATGTFPVPANGKVLKLSAGLSKVFVDEFGAGAKNGKMQAYIYSDKAEAIAKALQANAPAKGYDFVPDSAQQDSQGDVQLFTAGFSKGSELVAVAIFGPLDASTITEFEGLEPGDVDPATSVKAQLKPGDTVVFIVTGTK